MDCTKKVLYPYTNGMQDDYEKERKKHKDIIKYSCSVHEARKKFGVVSDFTETDMKWIERMNLWGEYIQEKDICISKIYNDIENSFLSVENEGPKREKTIYDCLRRKKINKPINDYTVTNCFSCNTPFSFIQRKHHCRACGRIFCYSCAKEYEIIPLAVVEYECMDTWIVPNQPSRVCASCKKTIQRFHNIESIINYFEVMGYTIHECLKAATICNLWKEAVCIYLSECRDIQNQPISQSLSVKQKMFLLTNKNYLCGHSTWMLPFLKLGFECFSFDTNRDFGMVEKYPCSDMLCYNECKETFTKYDCLVLLNGPLYDKETKKYALDCLQELDEWESIAPFLPMELDIIQEFILQQPNMFLDFYWMSRINAKYDASMSIFCNKLISKHATVSNTIQETLLLVHHLEHYTGDLYTLAQSMNTLKVPFQGPFGIIDKFSNEITVKRSVSKPMMIYYYEGEKKKGMLYKKEDVRKDMYLLKLIRVMYDLCEPFVFDIGENEAFLKHPTKNGMNPMTSLLDDSFFDYGSPFPIYTLGNSQSVNKHKGRFLSTYHVCPIDEKSGFIELVTKANTLSSILSKGTISNYLYTTNPNKTICTVVSNYAASLAFWTVVAHVFGIGDRHMENIMIRTDGVLFHIDYGFIFGNDSTVNSSLASLHSNSSGGLVRLDEAMIEGLGGPEMLGPFKEKCGEIYCIFRNHYHFLCGALFRLVHVQPKILDVTLSCSDIENFLRDRLALGQTEKEAKEVFSHVIEASRGTLKNKVSDVIHNNVSKVKEMIWG